MARTRLVIDLATGERSVVPYTAEEEAAAEAAHEAEQARLASVFKELPRPAFLFMMGKIGVTEEQVEALIGQMPEGAEAEQDAKALALIVFRNQVTFKRDNSLLASLASAAGISSETIDTAWRAAEGLTW